MSLILDAYNVLHLTHVLPDEHALVDAPGLCELIDRSGFYGGRAYVVCDGAPPGGGATRRTIGSVELIYAGGGKDADSLIEQMAEADHSPRDLVIVSNDHRVRRAATRRRGRAVSSESFLLGLGRALERRGGGPRSTEKPTSTPADVDMWMREFGLTDATPTETKRTDASIDREADHWMREFGYEPGDDD